MAFDDVRFSEQRLVQLEARWQQRSVANRIRCQLLPRQVVACGRQKLCVAVSLSDWLSSSARV